jgi:hypothetical protein
LFLSPENIDFYATNLYDAFRVRDQEIRLLQLLPGSWADEIRCEFAGIARLDNQVRQYEALSYSAGDVNDTRSIQVNGHNFNVFASLFSALRHLRALEIRTTWIDQICINQKDLEEKARQVLLMRGIYTFAYRIAVWLDDSATYGADGVDLIKELYVRWLKEVDVIVEPSMKESPKEAFAAMNLAYDTVAAWLSGFSLDPQNFDKVQALAEILQSGWWRRCWVYQELVANEETLFV